MFKLIIADTEVGNIRGIESYIKQNFSYIHIEKTFYSEEGFYGYFNSSSEYILIMDLRFFSGNFYKSIKNFHIKYPKINIILYGKIEDIEYMKKIEQELKIIYTLRPVKPVNLKKCIESVLLDIEKIKNLSDEELLIEKLYRQNFNVFEDKFLHTLISGRMSDEEEIKSNFEYFNINIKENFTVAIVRIDSFRKVIENFEPKQKQTLILKILNIVNQNLTIGKAFINLFNEVVIIFSQVDDINEILPILEEIKIEIYTKLNLAISIGVGRIYDNFKNIKTSFNEATFALRHRFIIGKNCVISIDQVEPQNRYTASYPVDREQVLVYSAVIGQYDYCIKILDEIFSTLNNAKEIYETMIPQFVTSLLISINRTYAEKGSINENINQFFSTSDVLKLKDLSSAYDFLKDGLKKLCDHICKKREEDENKIFQDIVEHINQKYYNQINYKYMSEKLNCKADYLKKIFEEKAKDNIYDYLHKVRIEEAKKLILNTDLTDDIIAVNVGYENVTNFRKMFKHIEGCLAGDFRYVYKDFRGN